MDGTALSSHDVDNRLKDIMDALQGRAGGSKKIKRWFPIIPNDKQIYRVTIEKALPPKQSKGLGHLMITRFRDI
jgi:Holliday junction resolvase RusA-like endonuclease